VAGVKESALNFGPGEALVGILTRPGKGTTPAVEDLAVVFLNSGILHRVGPNRLHVRLARALAACAVPSLRMDLPGIGDSRLLETGASITDENLHAVRCALDLLESRGVAKRFALFGLCSGAGDAFRAACADPRVVGICVVDPPTLFPTWKSAALRTARWAVRPRSWYRLATGRYGIVKHLWKAAGLHRPVARPEESPVQDGPGPESSLAESKQLVRQSLPGLVAREVRICYVITGDQSHVYNYRTQLLDSFPGMGLERVTRLELFPDAAHTFPHEASRVRLEETLMEWIRGTAFPGHTPTGPADPASGGASAQTRPAAPRQPDHPRALLG
jgi:hypothetical protein